MDELPLPSGELAMKYASKNTWFLSLRTLSWLQVSAFIGLDPCLLRVKLGLSPCPPHTNSTLPIILSRV